MSANISNSITGQVQAFFVVGENKINLPWHRTGQFFETAPTLEQVIQLCGFNNELIMVPAQMAYNGEVHAVPGKCVVYDTVDRKALGVVSDRFALQQRYTWAQSLRPLIEEHGFTLDAGGLLKNGQTSWLNFKTDQRADIRPGDPVTNNLLACDGVTGLRAAMLGNVVTRVVCANTEAAALAEGTMVKIQHRGDIRMKYAQLVQAYACSFENQVEQWRAMAGRYVTQTEVDGFITQLTGKTAEEEKRSGGQRDQILAAFESSELGNGQGTAWDLFNAVTEMVTHSEGRGENGAQNALSSQLFGAGAKLTQRAHSLIMGTL